MSVYVSAAFVFWKLYLLLLQVNFGPEKFQFIVNQPFTVHIFYKAEKLQTKHYGLMLEFFIVWYPLATHCTNV